jgi:arginyl-tRNA synthetase
LAEGAPAAAAVIARQAQAGDVAAAKMVLERVAPISPGRRVSFDLRPINCVADAGAAIGDVLRALADGKLTLEESKSLIAQLETYREAVRDLEFDRRLQALEQLFPELNEADGSLATRLATVEEQAKKLSKPVLIFTGSQSASLKDRFGRSHDLVAVSTETPEQDFVERATAMANKLCYGVEVSVMSFEEFEEMRKKIRDAY